MSAIERVDAVVVGAGVVGLACARALAARGREVIILERHTTHGSETSARNSEVIHAGIYYPAGSLKARLCVAGRAMLYEYCRAHQVAHQRCGKLLVATEPAQEDGLAELACKARANGVDDLHWLDGAAARALEPQLHCHAALHSPSTGIVDSHGLMLALLGEAQAHGAVLALASPATAARIDAGGMVLAVGGEAPLQLRPNTLINCAGHGALPLAAAFAGLPQADLPRAHFAKGSYFSLAGKSPFSRLVYPLPEVGGTGVHLTLDLAGQARFGPDVEWLAAPDYRVDPARAAHFYAQIRRYWPALPDGALNPAYAGVRPTLYAPPQTGADFRIDGPAVHGIPGLVNLFGIESPGLTACLAIAAQVVALLDAR